MKLVLRLCVAGVMIAFILLHGTGCATVPKPIPATYYQMEEPEVAVEITQIAKKATLRDSGGGGLLGSMTSGLSRGGSVRDALAQFNGDVVKELLRQNIESKLEQHFFVEEDSDLLTLKVRITHWGAFVPVTFGGIRTGAFQFEIMGQVRVIDEQQQDKQVADITVTSHVSMGNDPEEADAQQVLMEAVESFSTQAVDFLLRSAPRGEVIESPSATE